MISGVLPVPSTHILLRVQLRMEIFFCPQCMDLTHVAEMEMCLLRARRQRHRAQPPFRIESLDLWHGGGHIFLSSDMEILSELRLGGMLHSSSPFGGSP